VVDSTGNFYVADYGNNTIRKITPAGMVSTYAGSPNVYGAADGNASDARFYTIMDLAMDPADNLYVADYGNNRIRKITPSGTVSTFAIGITYPRSLSVLPDGSLAAAGNDPAVYRISTGGVVSLIAGSSTVEGTTNGVGADARFGKYSKELAVDASGNIYVADGSNHLLRKIDPTFNVTTVAGIVGSSGTNDGPVATATLNSPFSLAFDSAGNFFFSDSNTIRKLTPDGVVSTVTGVAGTQGYQDGAPGVATFYGPSGMAIAAGGNLIVADAGNHCIRMISPAGQTSTLAGKGNYGSNDGIASAAKFLDPDGITVDRNGIIYVSDRSNNTIRRITPAGEVTTLAGKAGVPGSADGPGADARFNYPRGLTTNAAGDVFVSDKQNFTIRKITSAGIVSTVAGLAGSSGSQNGVGSAARFVSPADVVADSSGVLYVAELTGNKIRRIALDGMVTTYAPGSVWATTPFVPDSSPGTPIALAMQPDSTLLVILYNANNIIKLLPDNSQAKLAGSATYSSGSADGLGTAASFYRPVGIAADAAGNAYVADTPNCTIRKITPNGWVSTIGGTLRCKGQGEGIGAAAWFNDPTSIAVGPDGAIYVANKFGNNIVKGIVTGPEIEVSSGMRLAAPVRIDSFGSRDFGSVSVGSQSVARLTIQNAGLALLTNISASISGTHAAEFSIATSPATSISAGGTSDLVVGFTPGSTGAKSAVLHIFSSDLDEADFTINLNAYATDATPVGALCWNLLAGNSGGLSGYTNGRLADARFYSPGSLAMGRDGSVFIADTNNHAIRKITREGIVSTPAGQVTASGSADGKGAFARFNSPKGITLDPDQNLYVADTSNHTIRKVSPDGTVTLMAGAAGLSGTANGSGGAARFNLPSAITYDPVGLRLIVADTGNHSLRAVSMSGLVTTIAGVPLSSGTTDGSALTAKFSSPIGVAVDPVGKIIICDTGNHTLRTLDTAGNVATLAGLAGTLGSLDGQGGNARLKNPTGICADVDGTVYFTDGGHTIRKASPDGNVITIGGDPAGSSGSLPGIGTNARFASPTGIAISPDGRLFVANSSKNQLFVSTAVGPDMAILKSDYSAMPNHSADAIEAPARGQVETSYVVTNAGTSSLSGIAASLLGPDANLFHIVGGMPLDLDPGTSFDMRIRFSPDAPGSVNASASLVSNDPDENPYEINFTGTGIPLRDFWRKSFFSTTSNTGNAADLADPDHDGLCNLVEFAFGMDPWVSCGVEVGNPVSMPESSVFQEANGPVLSLVYFRRKASGLSGVSYVAEFGSSLENGGPGGWSPSTAVELIENVNSSWEKVIIQDTEEAGQPARFGRIRIIGD
jgi:sugar lactone lactonase YvrE